MMASPHPAPADSFLWAWLRQFWHCAIAAHKGYTLRVEGRVMYLGCRNCHQVFWRRAGWR